MEKHNIYLLAGLAWMACGIFQYKNNNTFMIIVSAIISVWFFLLAIYKKHHK